VAQYTGQCGTAIVSYDERCVFTCVHFLSKPGSPYQWVVSCPDGDDDWTETTGSGRGEAPPKPGHEAGVTVNGALRAIAFVLAKEWDRPVICPPDLGDKIVNGTFEGSPEEIARALGLGLPKG
jgi:hypothetical protein